MSRISARGAFKCSGAPNCANAVIHECKKCKINVHKYCNVCYKQSQYFCKVVLDDRIHNDYCDIGADSEPPEWEMGRNSSSKKIKSKNRGRQPSYLAKAPESVAVAFAADSSYDGLDLSLCGKKRSHIGEQAGFQL